MKKKPKSTRPVSKAPSSPARSRKSGQARRRPKKGTDLFNHVIKLTGIPAKTIHQELKLILERKNIDVKNLTLDQLRLVVASYLREIMGNLLDRSHSKRPEINH